MSLRGVELSDGLMGPAEYIYPYWVENFKPFSANLLSEMRIGCPELLDKFFQLPQVFQGHSTRVAYLADWVCERMGWSEEERGRVKRSALVHDLGKLGIPQDILLKGGALTEEEWSIIRRHSLFGYDMVVRSGVRPELVDAEVPKFHHERWDGGGYPLGFGGSQIPFIARVITLADSWDAAETLRPGSGEKEILAVVDELYASRGTIFDPGLVDRVLGIGNGGERLEIPLICE
jgi:HD-GYP domain-containing protein (c-di-GMP phosphodiesterase class II)